MLVAWLNQELTFDFSNFETIFDKFLKQNINHRKVQKMHIFGP